VAPRPRAGHVPAAEDQRRPPARALRRAGQTASTLPGEIPPASYPRTVAAAPQSNLGGAAAPFQAVRGYAAARPVGGERGGEGWRAPGA
jgi:hypothetical protein